MHCVNNQILEDVKPIQLVKSEEEDLLLLARTVFLSSLLISFIVFKSASRVLSSGANLAW